MKETNPIKQAANDIMEADKPLIYLLDQFNARLAKQPTEVARHDQGYEYLPISYVRNLLNQIYYGRVQTSNFEYSVIHDQLVGSIQLKVFHPYTKEWQTYSGCAATQIRRYGKNSPKGWFKKGDLIPNGISMDLPRLKADCIKNAAKEIGKVFGADLNRKADQIADYEARFATHVNSNTYSIESVKTDLLNINTVQDLNKYIKSNPLWANDGKITQIFSKKLRDLQDENSN